MTIEFNCPHCDKILKTSEDKAGRQAKCPGCGEVIAVPNLEEQQADIREAEREFIDTPGGSISPPVVRRERDRYPEAGSSDDTKLCPFCGETIKAAAIKCRFCRQYLDGSDPTGERLSDRREMRPFPPGEVISDAWKLLLDRMGLLIGSFIVVSLLTCIVGVIGAVPFGLGQQFLDQDNVPAAIGALSISLVISIAGMFFVSYLHAGYMTLQLRVARQQPAELGDLFSGGPYAGRMLLNSIVFGMMMILGAMACVIPAFFLLVMFFPYGYVLVDRNPPGLGSLGTARQLTRGNWGSIFLVLIVAWVAAMAGTMACYVGLLFAQPFVNLMFAVAYDRMTCQTPLDSIPAEGEAMA